MQLVTDQHVSPSEVAALTQRVTGVEAAVDSIRKDIHALVSKFDERSKMPWGTLLAAAGFFWTVMTTFVTVGGGVVAWGLLSQTANIVKGQDEFKATYENNRIVSRQDQDAKFAAIDRALQTAVPRGEHERVWQADAQRFLDQQRQIDELKAQLSSLYGVRDFFDDIKDRVDRLEKVPPTE